jgi:hypothetical protein
MSRKPKTEGLEWLLYSLSAFNGSGYADMNSPEDFLESYVAYKLMRKKPQAVRLAELYREEALYMLEELLEKTYGAGRQPSEKSLQKFNSFRQHAQSHLL